MAVLVVNGACDQKKRYKTDEEYRGSEFVLRTHDEQDNPLEGEKPERDGEPQEKSIPRFGPETEEEPANGKANSHTSTAQEIVQHRDLSGM
jgi:hypothetical protein